MLVPLKLKYRNPNSKRLNRQGIDPPGGTLVFQGGSYKAKTSNAGTKGKQSNTLRPRKKAYGPF